MLGVFGAMAAGTAKTRPVHFWGRSTPPPPVVQDLYPAAAYSGTEGTGFAGGSPLTTAPTPSTYRLVTDTPKCALTWREDDREALVADEIITFAAYAKGGIAKVRVVCEGNYVDVMSESLRDRVGFDNVTYHNEPGYHVNLKHASFPTNGWVTIYAIAYPNDNNISPRVIGPFLRKRKVGAYHDFDKTVAPTGADYTTLNAAINAAAAARAGGAQHFRIRPIGTQTYDQSNLSTLAGGWTNKGLFEIWPNEGDTILFAKASGGSAQFGFDFQGTRFRRGVRFDVKRLGYIFSQYGTSTDVRVANAPSFAGCEIFNSSGRYSMSGSFGWESEKAPQDDGGWSTGGRYFETNVHDCHVGPKNWKQIRNVTITDCTQDHLNPLAQVYNAGFQDLYNVKSVGMQNGFGNAVPALSITGPSGVTVKTTGTIYNTAGQRQLVFERGGSTVFTTHIDATGNWTSTVDGGPTSPTYYNQGVADEINAAAAAATTPGVGMNGVAVTVLSNAIYSSMLGGQAGFTATALSATPFIVNSQPDIHIDTFQGGADMENILFIAYESHDSIIQYLFFSDSSSCKDVWFINCATIFPGGKGQWNNANSHSGLVHCSHLGQYTELNAYSSDPYCGYEANIMDGLIPAGGGNSLNNVNVSDNIFINSGMASWTGTNGSNNSFNAGAVSTLVSNASGGDYTPIGLALTKKVTARVKYDRIGQLRGATTSPGAQIAAAGG